MLCVKHILTCERAKNMGLFTQAMVETGKKPLLTQRGNLLLLSISNCHKISNCYVQQKKISRRECSSSGYFICCQRANQFSLQEREFQKDVGLVRR